MKCKSGSHMWLIAIVPDLDPALRGADRRPVFGQDQEPKYTQEEYKAYAGHHRRE